MNSSKTSSDTCEPNVSPIPNNPAAQQSGADSKAQLYLEHPPESPEIVGALPYLIHPPSRISSTASWIAFRDKTLLPLMQQKPDDPNLPGFLKQVETILAWRAQILPEERFWKKD